MGLGVAPSRRSFLRSSPTSCPDHSPASSPRRSKVDIEATTLLARPSPGPRRLTSGQPLLVGHRILTGGRQSILHVRTHAATSCRQHAENIATAQLSAALRRHPSEASGPSPRLPFSAFVVSHRGHAHRLPQGHPPPFHAAAVPVHFAHPVGLEDWLARCLRDVLRIIHGAAYGKPVWRPRPRVPRHPRSRLPWPAALPSRRLARALAGPSPAPAPDPRTVRLSASRLLSLTARRGSNVPSRAVGSS